MGTSLCGETPVRPSVDVYLDKVIKYLVLPVTFLLGLISLIVLYLVDKVRCYDSKNINSRDSFADEFCWNSFRSATFLPATSTLQTDRELPHKIFPIMLMCEPVAIALPLIIWYWCFGREFSYEIQSLIDHSNNLTEYYRKYDKGMRKSVTEAVLHREIDNILEYLAYLLMTKSHSIFKLYVLKWCVLMIALAVCFGGFLGILYPDLVVFTDQFTCLLLDKQKSTKRTAVCNIPTFMFLRAVWYFNIVVLGLLILGTLIQLIELSVGRKYTNTFFYRNIPGISDSRLADCIDKYYNSRHVNLISKFCEQNSNLCSDTGLSKSLSRKYGIYDGKTPGRGTIMDKHFPVIQPEQMEKFRLSSEIFFRRKRQRPAQKKTVANRRKINPINDRHIPTSVRDNVSSGYNSLRISSVAENDSLNYMTPYLMARKLEKDERDMLSLNLTIESQSKMAGPTPRSLDSDITFEDLEFKTSTPRPIRKDDISQRLYGRKFGVKFDPISPDTTGHYPKFASRTRELNPFAYRLRNVMRQNKVNNMTTWRP